MQDVLKFPDHVSAIVSPFVPLEAVNTVDYAEQDCFYWKLLDNLGKAIAQNVKIV